MAFFEKTLVAESLHGLAVVNSMHAARKQGFPLFVIPLALGI
jgi:hypothetical protein